MSKFNIDNAPSLTAARKRFREDVKTINFSFDKNLMNVYNDLTYYVQTYGCQANEADSEEIRGILEVMGLKRSDDILNSDVVVLNTCAIRENAENKVFGEIGRLKHQKEVNDKMVICMSGCMAQEEVVVKKIKESYPYVDIVFGTHNIYEFPNLLKEAINRKQKTVSVRSEEGDIYEGLPKIRESKHKAWVNIMFGCNQFCTYCIVPYTRGKERSRKHDDIIKEVKDLIVKGYKEITLLGQNVDKYGMDLQGEYDFSYLLEDLAKLNIPRIRFTTSYPRDFSSRTIEMIAKYPNIMPYVHFPVQSGSNKILKLMNRKYTREDYISKVMEMKHKIPGVSITTDIIVGFPGETEEDFQATLDLVKECDFEGAYTFLFSPRAGTPAYKMEFKTPLSERKKRLYRLNELVNKGYLKGNKRFEGKVVKVLVDGYSKTDKEMYSGYSEHNKLVNFSASSDCIQQIVKVKIVEAKTWFLIGELVKE